MKKKRLIIAVVIICCVILYIWQTNKIHNTPKKDTAVSTESNATTQQAETTTQVTTQTSTETTMESDTEEYFEEDTEEEAQLKKTIAELMKEEKNTTPEGIQTAATKVTNIGYFYLLRASHLNQDLDILLTVEGLPSVYSMVTLSPSSSNIASKYLDISTS